MDSKELETTSLNKLIAAQRVTHTPIEKVCKDLGITRYKYNKIVASKEYKDILKDMAEEATSHAVSTWKASVSELISESHRVLKEKLKQNDLKAVEIVLKSIGVDAQEQVQAQTNIQVVLPNFEDTPKEVQGEVLDVES